MILLHEHLLSLGLSRAQGRKALETGKVFRRGVPTADAGQEVDPADIELRERAPRLRPGRDPSVIFHDEHLAVLYKPSGMLSVAAPKRGADDNLVSWAARTFGAAHPVHRLDEATSGLMMVALTPDAQFAIKAELEAHRIERRYLALVRGAFPERPQRLASRLGRHPESGRRCSVGEYEPGKDAVTHVQLLERLPRASLVGAQLETGRTHQVRIHLADTKHPVLADPLYGRRGELGCRRLALHAAGLSLVHPATGQRLSFDAGLADNLAQFRRHVLRRAENPDPKRRSKPKTKSRAYKKKLRAKKRRNIKKG